MLNELHRLEAVHPGHENIDNEQVEASRPKQLQAGATVVDGFDRMRGALKQHLDRSEHRSIVIDDENARHRHFLTKFVVQPERYTATVTYFLIQAKADTDGETLMVDASLLRCRETSKLMALGFRRNSPVRPTRGREERNAPARSRGVNALRSKGMMPVTIPWG
jgi:hypothetical protein